MNAPQFITDSKGKKISVVLTLKAYKRILDELEDIRLYDEGLSAKGTSLPADIAFRKIEAKRKKM